MLETSVLSNQVRITCDVLVSRRDAETQSFGFLLLGTFSVAPRLRVIFFFFFIMSLDYVMGARRVAM